MIRSIGTIGNQIFQSLVSEHIPPIHFLLQWLHCSDYMINLGNSCNYLTQFWYRTVYEESAQPVAIWCRPLPLPWNVDRMSTTWPSCSILLLLQKWGHGNCWLQHEFSEYRKRHLNKSLRFFRNKREVRELVLIRTRMNGRWFQWNGDSCWKARNNKPGTCEGKNPRSQCYWYQGMTELPINSSRQLPSALRVYGIQVKHRKHIPTSWSIPFLNASMFSDSSEATQDIFFPFWKLVRF